MPAQIVTRTARFRVPRLIKISQNSWVSGPSVTKLTPNPAILWQNFAVLHANRFSPGVLMLKNFLNFLKAGNDGEELGADRKHAAAAALLVEAARLDRKFDTSEHEALKKMIAEKFGLTPEAAQALIGVAEGENKVVYDDHMFLEGIKQGFTQKEKLDLIEMLWEISMSDNHLHALEEYLIWHTAEALGISHEQSQQAKAAATANMA